MNLLHPGAGTINPDIISSEITGGSVGGGGHTNDWIISSVLFETILEPEGS